MDNKSDPEANNNVNPQKKAEEEEAKQLVGV